MAFILRRYHRFLDEIYKNVIPNVNYDVQLKFNPPREILPGWMLLTLDYRSGFEYDPDVDGECDPYEIGNDMLHMTVLMTSTQTRVDVTVGGYLDDCVRITGPRYMKKLLLRAV